MSEQHIKGLAALNKFMQELPVKIERNVLRGSLRAGMKVVLPAAKAGAAHATGQLRDGLKIGTRAKGGVVTAYVKAGGPHAYLAKWIEYGVKAHNIAAKKSGWLSFMNVFAKEVEHPGLKPRAFMRPALDGQATAAVNASAEYMKNRLATRHGLDTSGVKLEGDE